MNHVTCYMFAVNQGELSKQLFGRAGRLRLAGWVIENVPVGEFFFQAEVRQGTGDVPNEVRENLKNLESLHLIEVAHRDPGPGRRQYYRRLDSPIWAIFEQALKLNKRIRRAQKHSAG